MDFGPTYCLAYINQINYVLNTLFHNYKYCDKNFHLRRNRLYSFDANYVYLIMSVVRYCVLSGLMD